jgi:hypothetical protein
VQVRRLEQGTSAHGPVVKRKTITHQRGETMKAKNFDEIVTARANERAQNKINIFKKEIKEACAKLLNYRWQDYRELPEVTCAVLRIVLANATVGWPREIWEFEENLVSEELLNTMDEMQKALIAASRLTPGENIKEEPIIEAAPNE